MSDKDLEYETKCRRCGNVTRWNFSDRKYTCYTDFNRWAHEHSSFPFISHCDKCLMNTVQDLVSFSDDKTES